MRFARKKRVRMPLAAIAYSRVMSMWKARPCVGERNLAQDGIKGVYRVK